MQALTLDFDLTQDGPQQLDAFPIRGILPYTPVIVEQHQEYRPPDAGN